MALTGFWLQGASGKLAGSVLQKSVSGTIIRQNVTPSNPQTPNQVMQRARFKLISQLAANLAPVIAIQKEGSLSPRNQFIKLNMDKVLYGGGSAMVTYENVQITKSKQSLPAVAVNRSLVGGIQLSLAQPALNISRVVYSEFRKDEDGQLIYEGSVISDFAGLENKFPASLPYRAGDLIFYAYGMNDADGDATTKYGDMEINSGVDFARLIVDRSLSLVDYNLTKTRGTSLFAGESGNITPGDGQKVIYATAMPGGAVEGTGVYDVGTAATLRAYPDEGYSFKGWYVNDARLNSGQQGTLVSADAEYVIEVTETLSSAQSDLVAVFEKKVAKTLLLSWEGPDYTANIGGTEYQINGYNKDVEMFVLPGTPMTFSTTEVPGAGETLKWHLIADSGATISKITDMPYVTEMPNEYLDISLIAEM